MRALESRRIERRLVGEAPAIDPPADEARPPGDPPAMHPLLAKQPRYCLACGERLSLPESKDEPAICGHCLRPFDPADPETFRPVPPPTPRRWWESDALPGGAWLALYATGNAVAGWLMPDWVVWMGGGAGHGQTARAGAAAGVLIAVLWILLGLLPWVFACVYLLLLAFENHLRDEVIWYFTAGGLFGVVCTLGFAPPILVVGMILGVLAGLVRQWRMSLWASS